LFFCFKKEKEKEKEKERTGLLLENGDSN